MGVITELSPQKKREERFNLYLDGEFLCGINLESVVKNHLKVGMEIDGEALRRAVFESEASDAFDRAANYVSHGKRTERELTDYLQKKGFDAEVASFAVEKLKSYRYAGDEDYLKSYFAYNSAGKGKFRIRQELKQRGIPDALAEERLSDFEEDGEEALRLAQKFMRSRELDMKGKAALWRHLTARGYSAEIVKSVAEIVFSGLSPD